LGALSFSLGIWVEFDKKALFIDYQRFNFHPCESNLEGLSKYDHHRANSAAAITLSSVCQPLQTFASMELRNAKLKDWKGIASIYKEAFASTCYQGLLP
jgi:hypothetical protein